MAVDFALDPDTLDLDMQGTLMSGLDRIRATIPYRVGAHRGSDLVDRSRGLPWVEWFSTKPVPEAAIVAGIRREIEGIEGVLRVEGMASSFSRTTRTLTISCGVVCDEGFIEAEVVAGPDLNFSFTAAVSPSASIAP